jgi:hypothetical protein
MLFSAVQTTVMAVEPFPSIMHQGARAPETRLEPRYCVLELLKALSASAIR